MIFLECISETASDFWETHKKSGIPSVLKLIILTWVDLWRWQVIRLGPWRHFPEVGVTRRHLTPVDHALDLSLLRKRQVSSLHNHIVLNTTTNRWQIDGKSINPATSLSQSQTLEGLFKTDTAPIKGLQPTCVASIQGLQRNKDTVTCGAGALGRGAIEIARKLTQPLIVFLKKNPCFHLPKKNWGIPLTE